MGGWLCRHDVMGVWESFADLHGSQVPTCWLRPWGPATSQGPDNDVTFKPDLHQALSQSRHHFPGARHITWLIDRHRELLPVDEWRHLLARPLTVRDESSSQGPPKLTDVRHNKQQTTKLRYSSTQWLWRQDLRETKKNCKRNAALFCDFQCLFKTSRGLSFLMMFRRITFCARHEKNAASHTVSATFSVCSKQPKVWLFFWFLKVYTKVKLAELKKSWRSSFWSARTADMPRLTQFGWVSRKLGLFCTLTLVAHFTHSNSVFKFFKSDHY